MRNIYKLLLALFLFAPFAALAQVGEGTIKVIIKDADTDEDIIGANVVVEEDGNYISGAATDAFGMAVISSIEPGIYDLRITYVGYQPKLITGVRVNADNITSRTVKISEGQGVTLGTIDIEEDRDPLIKDTYGGGNDRVTADEIIKAPVRGVNGIVALSASTYSVDGGTPSFRGARTNANITYIDGMPVRGSGGVPQSAYEEIQVIQSGVPAEYGDATGGVINITTKGASARHFSRFEAISSQFLDGFGYNTFEFLSTGPFLTKVIDSVSGKKVPVVGFMISGNVNFRKDGDPSPIGIWKVKDDVINGIKNDPLRTSPLGSGFVSNSEFISMDDLEKVKVKPNTRSFGYNFNGKVDWNVNERTIVTAGGRLNRFAGNDYIYTYSLLNFENNSEFTNNTYAGYIRLRQRFESDKDALIQNANYMIQFDYTHFKNVRWDPRHQDNIFRYGHVGNFDIYRQQYAWDNRTLYSNTDSSMNVFALYELETPFDTLVRFRPSQYNETSTKWTSTFFDFRDGDVGNLSEISQNGALINGTTPSLIYSLWSDVGTPYTSYAKAQEDQVSVNLKFGGSIKNHNLKLGFRYEERTLRSYGIGATGLWNTMRQSVNRHIRFRSTDVDSAIYIFSDGEYRGYELHRAQGAFLDTVRFERTLTDQQTSFDRNFRQHLIDNGYKDVYGNPINQYSFLNPDAYDPSVFQLSWFSADDLLQNGSVRYYGYDHLGNKLENRPSLDDYLDNTSQRLIAPYNPIYMAGYIQDEVTFKDLNLRMGVRVDRFDANQFVLKDEYSLYPIRTVSEVQGLEGFEDLQVPETIGEEYKVYVDDPYNPTRVVGYRDGNTWYLSDGSETDDPSEIASQSETGTIAPYTYFTSKSEENEIGLLPESFEDYEPQINVMPRVAVSFPISTQAMFFANYDVLTQRPPSGNVATIDAYYYLPARSTGTIGNPNLKPEKTISYEVGFQQTLGDNMAVRFNAYYREMRDMIQIVPRRYAYPVDYTSFGNIDFGTVKGFSFNYQLRPDPTSANKNVRLEANYTLQFANATGSGTASQAALIQAGQPNLRTLQPTSRDVRHNIVLSLDYRYGSGAAYNGPIVGKKDRPILENAGINLIMNTSSGRPYSGQQNVTQAVALGVANRATLDGQINGNRYPWIFNTDLRIDKTWMLTLGKKTDASGDVIDQGKATRLQVYLWARNVFNTRNIVGLYRYTGLPDDDGWINSAEGQQTIDAQTNQQAYIDLYRIKVQNPSNYTLPRLIRLGVVFSL